MQSARLMPILRTIAVAYWTACLLLYIGLAAGAEASAPPFGVSFAVTTSTILLWAPIGGSWKRISWPRITVALFALSLIMPVLPMIVGTDGAEDSITGTEFMRLQRQKDLESSGIAVGVAGYNLGLALFLRRMRGTDVVEATQTATTC